MSHTTRKPTMVVRETENSYVSRTMERLYRRYDWEMYITPEWQRRYDEDYKAWLNESWFSNQKTMPALYHYKHIRRPKIEYDYEAEERETRDYYRRQYRDGYDRSVREFCKNKSNRKRSVRKFRQEVRHFEHKVMKDDWEDIPHPYVSNIDWWDYY